MSSAGCFSLLFFSLCLLCHHSGFFHTMLRRNATLFPSQGPQRQEIAKFLLYLYRYTASSGNTEFTRSCFFSSKMLIIVVKINRRSPSLKWGSVILRRDCRKQWRSRNFVLNVLQISNLFAQTFTKTFMGKLLKFCFFTVFC